MPTNPSAPQGNEPKIPRPEAEAMVKLMEQELALKRAQLAAEKGKKESNRVERWLALVLFLLVLLGALIWGFAQLRKARMQAPERPTPPPAAPARR
jgi:cytoskeletal protein RodZ